MAPSEAAEAEVLGPATEVEVRPVGAAEVEEVEVEVRRLAVADAEASRSARHRAAACAP